MLQKCLNIFEGLKDMTFDHAQCPVGGVKGFELLCKSVA